MLVTMPPAEHRYAKHRIAFVSGLSDPGTCALSPAQHDFLDALQASQSEILRLNFPYVSEAASAERSAPALLLASWRNAVQYRLARTARFRKAATRHFESLLKSTQRLLLVTLSCGLEIVRCAMPAIPTAASVTIVALGPVARRLPSAECYTVQGTRDYLSRAFFPSPSHAITGLGHLGYMQSGEVRALVNRYL